MFGEVVAAALATVVISRQRVPPQVLSGFARCHAAAPYNRHILVRILTSRFELTGIAIHALGLARFQHSNPLAGKNHVDGYVMRLVRYGL